MSDPRNKLQEMFEVQHRYGVFRDLLVRMRVRGLRCHADTIIEIESPITAICGANGTGKSTLLQIAASGYATPDSNDYPRFHISDFLVVGTLDPAPFTATAAIEFDYWQNDRSARRLTLSRRPSAKWSGYSRQPKRHVCFAGIGLYLPRIEQRDFMVQQARHINVRSHADVDQRVRNCTCKVLGHSYDHMHGNDVDVKGRQGYILSVSRNGASYSEAHMGFGEGRAQYLIAKLESIPERSLVLIEEPETSLHPGAQHEFAQYLLDVAIRRKHQIILTTHSEFILHALHSKSRIYLLRDTNGIVPLPGMTAQQARSLMTDGESKDLCILVEDEVGQAVLTELMRLSDPHFLKTVLIRPAGGKDLIPKAFEALKSTNLKIAAVRDGDKRGATEPDKFIFALPGNEAPEKELFGCDTFRQHMSSTYSLNLEDFRAELTGVDHHDWFERLAQRVQIPEVTLVTEAARCFARAVPANDRHALIVQLKEAANR